MADGLVFRRNILTNTFREQESIVMNTRSSEDSFLWSASGGVLRFQTLNSVGTTSFKISGKLLFPDYFGDFAFRVEYTKSANLAAFLHFMVGRVRSKVVLDTTDDILLARGMLTAEGDFFDPDLDRERELSIELVVIGEGTLSLHNPIIEKYSTWDSNLPTFDYTTAPDARFTAGRYNRVYQPR